jgi:hypothetical protein
MFVTREMALRVGTSISWYPWSSINNNQGVDTTHIVYVGIHCFGVETFLSLFILLYVLTYPYVTVQTKYQINAAR